MKYTLTIYTCLYLLLSTSCATQIRCQDSFISQALTSEKEGRTGLPHEIPTASANMLSFGIAFIIPIAAFFTFKDLGDLWIENDNLSLIMDKGNNPEFKIKNNETKEILVGKITEKFLQFDLKRNDLNSFTLSYKDNSQKVVATYEKKSTCAFETNFYR